jgi:hypothetical protein
MTANRIHSSLFVAVLFLLPMLLLGQSEPIDTTSESYKKRYELGKQIGAWLPFLVIFTLALMVVIRTYRLSQKNK